MGKQPTEPGGTWGASKEGLSGLRRERRGWLRLRWANREGDAAVREADLCSSLNPLGMQAGRILLVLISVFGFFEYSLVDKRKA